MRTEIRFAVPRLRFQRGLSLIECLVYIAILGVILSVGGMTLAKAWDQGRAVQRNADDILRAVHAGERWRADIRRATGPIRVSAESDGERVRIPTPAGDVIYRSTTNAVFVQAGPTAPELTLLTRVRNSHMTAEPHPTLTAWRWELELQPAQKKARLRPLFTFAAVPHQGVTP
jgi:prepilin-type N-terminal cleavage/methylation domain-containing protein